MSENGIYTWHTFAKDIPSELEFGEDHLYDPNKPFNLNKKSIKKSSKSTVKEKYDELELGKLSTLDDHSKFFLYSTL